VSGAYSHYATFHWAADEGQVADDVYEFVACGLVVPFQRRVVDVAELLEVAVGLAEQVAEVVDFLFAGGLVVDYYGVV
jgi:hypothetical protein